MGGALVRRDVISKADHVRVVVVADTHSLPHPDSARLIRALAPSHILHAGDIGDPRVLEDLSAIAPVTAVRGNIDEHSTLPDAIALRIGGSGFDLALLLTHIAVSGPRLRGDVAKLAAKAEANLVVCGHSHVPFIGRDRAITVFNPGSIGPRRFRLPIVFGILDVRASGVTLEHVSCETGERWRPERGS